MKRLAILKELTASEILSILAVTFLPLFIALKILGVL